MSRKLVEYLGAHRPNRPTSRYAVLACFGLLLSAFCVQSSGQGAPTPTRTNQQINRPASTPERTRTTVTRPTNGRRRPQTELTVATSPRRAFDASQRVMIVIHRLSGWRLQAWFALNETETQTTPEADFVHTRIVTGYALEDEHTIIARIPQAEIETFAQQIPADERSDGVLPARAVFEIISRDGKRQTARFVGLDGATGLSVLRLEPGVATFDQRGNKITGRSPTLNTLSAQTLRVLPNLPAPPFADPEALFTFNSSTVFTQAGMLFGDAPEQPANHPVVSEQVARDNALRVAPVLPSTGAVPVTMPLRVRQPVRLFAPRIMFEAGRPGNNNGFNIHPNPATARVQLGEIDGALTLVERASDGSILSLRVRIDVPLANAYVGAVATDDAGRLIGITRGNGGGTVGGARVSSAILLPSAEVRRAAARVVARQASVPRVWLGARGENLTNRNLQNLLADYGWTPAQTRDLARQQSEALRRLGVLLTAVAPGTPAAAAGLRPGDIVTNIDTRRIRSVEEFSASMREANVGQRIQFTVSRNEGSEQTSRNVTVTLSRQTLDAQSATRYAEQARRMAAQLAAVPPVPSMADAHGLFFIVLAKPRAVSEGFETKLLVVSVVAGSRAARFGFMPGDVIEQVGVKDATRETTISTLSSPSHDKAAFNVRRNGQTIKLSFTPESSPPSSSSTAPASPADR